MIVITILLTLLFWTTYKMLKNFSFCFAEFGGSVDIAAITNFIDNGGNVLVAASSSIGNLSKNILTYC